MTGSDRSDPVLRGLDGILADLEDFYKDRQQPDHVDRHHRYDVLQEVGLGRAP